MARRPKPSKAEKLNRAIERWQAKQEGAVIMLRKSAEQLAKLHRQRRRNLAKLTTGQTPAEATAVEPVGFGVIEKVAAVLDAERKDDGLDIPAALDRSKKLNALPDPRTKEKRAERKAVEKEKREAELTGKRRKMPLSGKTAMEQIREAVYGKPDRK
jgi:hypothetical protein